jgi:starch synthase (maltosyl-transferring)
LKQNASLAPRIALLNRIRKENYALQQLRNLTVHYSDDQSILVFSKHISANHAPDGKANTILVVVNCDPHSARETTIHLRLDELDVPASFKVKDLITGNSYNWGEHNFVRLDAFTEPAHIMRIER